MRGLAVRCFAIGAAVAALAGVLPAAAAPPPSPRRIMSMNLCTDMLLLQLVPKYRIASVTYLARDGVKSFAPGLADGVAVNHGSAEEIVAQHPDLILAGDVSTAMTRLLAGRVGAPVVTVKAAYSFDDIRVAVRQVGAAVGEPARAEALVGRMDAVLADLRMAAPPRPFRLAAWSGESAPGRGTLANAIIEAAGAVNVAARFDDARYDSFGVEDLLMARPEALLYGQAGPRSPSLTTQAANNPVVRRLYAGRTLHYPEALYACGLPQSADAALALRRDLLRLGR